MQRPGMSGQIDEFRIDPQRDGRTHGPETVALCYEVKPSTVVRRAGTAPASPRYKGGASHRRLRTVVTPATHFDQFRDRFPATH